MKKILFPLLLLLPLWASAQYSFTITGEYYGCGGKVTAEMQRLFNQYMSQYQPYGIPTRTECEQLRATVNAVNYSYGGCGFRLKASPCTGRDMDNTINIGAQIGGQTMNMQGGGQESSFFSPNSAIENKNWDKDIEERQRALNSKFVPPRTGDSKFDGVYIEDLNKPLVSVNLRNNEPSEYYFGDDLSKYDYVTITTEIQKIYSAYEEETGIDIESILYKEDKTQSEIELINDYERWRAQKLIEISNMKDMAICAAAPYEDFNNELLGYTKYYKITDSAPDKEVDRLLQLVDMCNNESMNQGFHAEILYNNETKEYVVSFRGTDDIIHNWDDVRYILSRVDMVGLVKGSVKGIYESQISAVWGLISGDGLKEGFTRGVTRGVSEAITSALDGLIKDLAEGNTEKLPATFHDLSTDVSQAIGRVLTQYKMAIEIGDVIKQISDANPNVRINITGHSMGGGEAIIAGAVSGQPTYAFNPAGVHDETFKYAEIDKSSSGFQNIHKITTDDDQLTNVQESKGFIGQLANKEAKKLAEKHGGTSETSVPIAIGKNYVIHTGKGHSIEPIAHVLINEEHNLESSIYLENNIEKEFKIYIRE